MIYKSALLHNRCEKNFNFHQKHLNTGLETQNGQGLTIIHDTIITKILKKKVKKLYSKNSDRNGKKFTKTCSVRTLE